MNPITTINSIARRVALFVLALTALLFGGAAPALAQTNNSTPPKLVGYLSRDNWGFVNIMDFDYDQQGNLYVLESGFGITRVSKFRPDGTFERTFGQARKGIPSGNPPQRAGQGRGIWNDRHGASRPRLFLPYWSSPLDVGGHSRCCQNARIP